MCSTSADQVSLLGAAIDDLAAGLTALADGPRGAATDIADRIARVWQLVVELDPELARRLPRYLGD